MGFNLIQGDCLEELPKLEEGSVDLILTDPPYLMNYKTNRRKDKSHRFCRPILNDDNELIIHQSIPLMHTLLKRRGRFTCSAMIPI